MSRSTCALIAERLDDEILAGLAYSDILWDPIVSIEPAGAEMAYDLLSVSCIISWWTIC